MRAPWPGTTPGFRNTQRHAAPRADREQATAAGRLSGTRRTHQNSPSSAFLSSSSFCLGSMSFHSGALGRKLNEFFTILNEAETTAAGIVATLTVCCS